MPVSMIEKQTSEKLPLFIFESNKIEKSKIILT